MDTLVLSSAYQPMHHVKWQDAISMWFAGRVEIVSVYEDRYINTVDEIFNVPSIVRFIGNVLKRFKFNRVVKFSRENVFIRDDGECQYCSKNLTKQNFTLDHVIPVSQSRSLGTVGGFNNLIPARLSDLLPFFWLQDLQQVTMFCQTFLPPCETGMT